MKRLLLEEIVTEIGGKTVQGTTPKHIRYVVDYPSDVSMDNTLLFDCYQRIQVWRFKPYKNCVILTEDPRAWSNINGDHAIVAVKDVKRAFQNFVRYYRRLFSIPVIAVTGTCGKTTTKEMIAHILTQKYKIQKTKRSKNAPEFNLDYLLGIDEDTHAAVFETAVGKKGDLLKSCRFFQPNVGVITNIGIDHLNQFSSHDAYIQAKGEMIPGLSYQGTLVLNADDENIKKIDLAPFHGKIITFGFVEEADFRVTDACIENEGMSFTLLFQGVSHGLFVPGYGIHNVYNAVAAIAATYALGVEINEAGHRLRTYRHLPGHMNVMGGIHGAMVLDDSWSSNPTSMRAALQVLDELSQERKKVAVLGKMAALGDFADEQYEQISRKLVEHNIDILITRGSIAKKFAENALRFGMKEHQVHNCTEIEEISNLLHQIMNEDTIVLVKSTMNDYGMESLIKNITM